MLAQNFKTPSDLGITDEEFYALVKVLGMLERREIPHYIDSHYDTIWGECPTGFNMVFSKSLTRYGVACCIMGWARHITYNSDLFVDTQTPELSRLFGMYTSQHLSKSLQKISPDEAAIALRNYLTTGEASWEEVF